MFSAPVLNPSLNYNLINSFKKEKSLDSEFDSVVIEVVKNIFVSMAPKTPYYFFSLVCQSIEELKKGMTGQRLLKKIQDIDTKIMIVFSDKILSPSCSRNFFKDFNGKICCHAKITLTQYFLSGGLGYYFDFIQTPPFIVLGHELIHAYRQIYGKSLPFIRFSNPQFWPNDEEYATVIGMPRKKFKSYPKITENALRQEHGLFCRWVYGQEYLKPGVYIFHYPYVIVIEKLEDKSEKAITIQS
jgi:hypothetical protein